MRRAAREATAYHEAGHAVVGFLLGSRIESVTIVSGDDFAGRVILRKSSLPDPERTSPQARSKLENYIIMILAGDIAQRRFRPRSIRSHHTSADRTAAVTLALSLCGSGESATAFLAWLHIRARNIVAMRWAIVERVAAALLARGALTGADLKALVLSTHYSVEN